jgi:S1-C subfamily serine protease
MAGTEFTCPACGAKSRSSRQIPDGARVKCPSCQKLFSFGETKKIEDESIPSADEVGQMLPAEEPAAPVAEVVAPEPEVIELPPPAVAAPESPESPEAIETPRPPAAVQSADAVVNKEQPSPRRRDRYDDDDERPRSRRRDRYDDEDDRPRSRRSRDDDDDYDDRPRSRRSRDDDFDDDDRSSRSKKGKKKNGSGVPIFIVVACVVFFMVVIIGGAVAGFLIWGGVSKTEPPKTFSVVSSSSQSNRPGDEDEDVAPKNLHEPAENGDDDDGPLSANLNSVLLDVPYASQKPRRLISPAPGASSDKPSSSKSAPPKMSPETLNRVKQSTTFMVVTMGDNRKASGSGFFIGKDLVATNAHVVGMLVPGSEKPKKIEVVVNSGQPNEVGCIGKLLIADPDNDLALVRVQAPPGKTVQFPPPLEIAGGAGLIETQSVVVFGFPLGEQIGKETTINETQVSSLRKDSAGKLERIQVKGGMEHGNSGGPVVNTAGDVIGVSVSKVEGTEINFAIPGERVRELLNGHLLTLTAGEMKQESAEFSMPLTVRASDPLKKIKSVTVDWWWGNAKDKAPASRQKPVDGYDRKTLTLSEHKGDYTCSVPLGSDFPSGKVLWVQAHQQDANGNDNWFEGMAMEILAPPDPKPVKLVYHPRKKAPKVAIHSSLVERISVEGGLYSIHFKTTGQLHEERLGMVPGDEWLFRVGIDRLDVSVLVNGLSQDRSVGFEDRKKYLDKTSVRVQAETGGRILSTSPRFKGVPKEAKEELSQFTQLLGQSLEFASMSYPQGDIKPKQSWEWQFSLPLPSSGNQFTMPVEVKYTYLGLRKVDGREVAELSLSGHVKENLLRNVELGENGPIVSEPKTTGKVTGYAFVDVKSGIVSRINIYVDSSPTTDVQFRQPSSSRSLEAKLAGTLEVKLQRQ